MIKHYFQGMWRDRYILFSLVNRDLQTKYRRSFLGVAWAILTPLGLAIMIGSVYSIIFKSDPKIFIPMLFAGLNPWLFINVVADGGTLAFIGAEGYLKQTTVNAQIFPARTALVAFVNLLYSVIAFFSVYLFLQPSSFGPKMLLAVPGLILLFIFGISLSNIAAVLNLNIRDFQPLQSLLLQGLFYVSPILFPAEMLEERGFEIIYKINPIYYLLEVVRKPMLGIEIPTIETYLTAVLIVTSMFIISIILVMKTKKSIVFKL